MLQLGQLASRIFCNGSDQVLLVMVASCWGCGCLWGEKGEGGEKEWRVDLTSCHVVLDYTISSHGVVLHCIALQVERTNSKCPLLLELGPHDIDHAILLSPIFSGDNILGDIIARMHLAR